MQYYVILIISSILMCFDMFAAPGQPANMDGTTHMINIATFYSALKHGDFPVGWTDGYANYGLPMGYFAQQLTSYLGAIFNFAANNVVVSFGLVYLTGTILSASLFYYLLRMYTKPTVALAGTFLFQFAPYRIINMYVRGALPEYFSSVFVLLMIISLLKLVNLGKPKWLVLHAVGVVGLILTHPMNLVTAGIIIGPMFIWGISQTPSISRYVSAFIAAIVSGLMLASYYLVPLLLEIKYFYYGQMESHFTPNSYLGLKNFVSPDWPYFLVGNNDILARGHFIKVGLLESILLIVFGIWLLWLLFSKKKIQNNSLIILFFIISIICLFLTTQWADWFYHNLSLLDAIQFPWRMLSSFIIVFPLMISLLINSSGYKNLISIVLIVVMLVSRVGQLYGKNVADYNQSSYFKTVDNPHNIAMNPVWSGPSVSYPVRNVKGEIIEGNGTITSREEFNSKRTYQVESSTPLRMVDNTFYFPGWKVLVDGQPTLIEYQDPHYRGVITYNVPSGKHLINVVFSDTKVRLLGKLLTGSGLLVLWFSKFMYGRFAFQKAHVAYRSKQTDKRNHSTG